MTKHKCTYDNKCIMPRVDYRCNLAYEHCCVFKKFQVLDPKSKPKRKITKALVDKLFKEDMGDY